MKLTQNERAAILAGENPTLIRKDRPDIKPGQDIVLTHSKPKRYWDRTTQSTFGAPRQSSAWITVTNIVRHRKGGWAIRYDVTDNRDPALMLARGGGYTTDPDMALDRDEAVLSHKDRRRLSVEARARRVDQRERDLDERRRQERALKLRLKEALNELDPVAGQSLLADLERRLEQAKSDMAADEAA